MKLPYLFILFMGMLAMTSCPRPYLPTLCEAPDSITIDYACYNPNLGLTIRASKIAYKDSTTQLTWFVFILPDTSDTAPFNNPQVNVIGTNMITLPDSILKDNRKLYVQINTTCAGINIDKAPDGRYNAFVKRYKKSTSCYQWEEQAF